jgi:hypothetical protein
VVPRGCGRRIGIDRDADGYLDRDEIDFGSDPANPLSPATNSRPHLGPLTLGTNGITLTWSALPALTYRLQYKNTLTDSLWLDISGDVVAVTNFPSKLDPAPATNNSRFYRIIVLP